MIIRVDNERIREDKSLLSLIKSIPLLAALPISKIGIKKLAGLTNQNYLISLPNQQFVLKVPCKKLSTPAYTPINYQNETINQKIAAKLGVSPNIRWQNNSGVRLIDYLNDSRHLKEDEINTAERLRLIIQNLKLLHKSKTKFKGELKTQTIKDLLTHYFNHCSTSNQKTLQKSYENAQYKLVGELGTLNDQQKLVPSHIDLAPENILLQGKKLWFIDWEYSAMASPYWDIAMISHYGKLDLKHKQLLLNKLLRQTKTCNSENFELKKHQLKQLQDYQFIIEAINNCWLGALANK